MSRPLAGSVPSDVVALAEYSKEFVRLDGLPRLDSDRFLLTIGNRYEPRQNNVERIRLVDVATDIETVRARLIGEGATGATWWIGPSASPPNVAELLVDLGFIRMDESPLTMLAIDRPPRGRQGQAIARPVRTKGELRTAIEIQCEVFGVEFEPNANARALTSTIDEDPEEVWFLATLEDGTPAGMGILHLAAQGGLLANAATLPAFKSRGVYTAVVAARYAEAAQRGHRWVVAQAVSRSAKILREMGFVVCGEIDLLLQTA